ncbi:MAG: type II secretion system F family protein [Candidatus Eremiobacteraeota bacterium]|nr:type II secretion system F family protein [Candidatus Eremiobacteraeota bacterium]
MRDSQDKKPAAPRPAKLPERKRSFLEAIRERMAVPGQDLAVFYNEMAFLYHAGIPLSRAIGILARQAVNARLREVLTKLQRHVESGHSLTDAMRLHPDVFSSLYITLIHTGEVSGTMETMLNRAAALKEKEITLSRRIGQAATYPLFIFFFMLLFILVMGRLLILNIVPLLKSGGTKLPLLTHMLIFIYGVISNPLIVCIAILTVLFLCLKYRKAMEREGPRLLRDRILYSVPLLGGLLKTIAFSRLCSTLSTLTDSGVSMLAALILAGEASGSALCLSYCRELRQSVAGGGFLHDGFNAFDFFSPMVRDMVRVGEESGTLPYLLAQAARLMEIQVDHALTVFTAALEPLMMAFLGIVVALLAFGVLVPLNGVVSSIS